MKDRLRSVLKHIIPFTDHELEQICDHFHPEHHKRNEILLHEGEVCSRFYFVFKGSIRTYFLDQKGAEITRYIMLDNWIGTALTSFISGRPSTEYIDATENCDLLFISRDAFFSLCEQNRSWQLFYQRILEMAYSFQNAKIEALVTLTAEERFRRAMQENPALMQRVSNKVLASYLDIKPETLSRLKSR